MDGPLILTVDDDADIRQLAAEALSDAGYRLIEAESGEAALELLRTGEPIDLVLTDIVMGGLNGVDLARQARRLRPETKFLFTSGYLPHIALDLDGEAVLGKPYRPADLLRRIRHLLAAAPD